MLFFCLYFCRVSKSSKKNLFLKKVTIPTMARKHVPPSEGLTSEWIENNANIQTSAWLLTGQTMIFSYENAEENKVQRIQFIGYFF